MTEYDYSDEGEGQYIEIPDEPIPLSDPDLTAEELKAVEAVLRSPFLGAGPVVDEFEKNFAAWLGRKYAIAVPSGTLGLALILLAQGVGPGDEVIAPAYSFRECAQAIAAIGATPVFIDIDYWSGCVTAAKAQAKISEKTRAILVLNSNGHPADWTSFRAIAETTGVALIEDCSESVGSRYKGELVGTFGDASFFDFSQPSPLVCGEGGMIVTDNVDLAMAIRRRRSHALEERGSVSVTSAPALQAKMSDISAALGLVQLSRIDEILAKRRETEATYAKLIQAFEGIKPPYVGPDVTEFHGFVYVVHLGTRYDRKTRDSIIEELVLEQVEGAPYCTPLHLQRYYFERGWRRGDLLVTEKVADRAVALPFHAHLSPEQIEFTIATAKDALVNLNIAAPV